jgi:hypothetical protein
MKRSAFLAGGAALGVTACSSGALPPKSAYSLKANSASLLNATKYGVLIHPDQSAAGIVACGAAVADLDVDLYVLEYVPTVYALSLYDAWFSSVPQSKCLLLLQTPTGSTWDSITPAQLAAYAAAFIERYPQIPWVEVINEPNKSIYYPESGIPQAAYAQYYAAAKAALPSQLVLGPVTSSYSAGWYTSDVTQPYATHGYGQLPPPGSWMTEQGGSDVVSIWQASNKARLAVSVYYQLADSADSPGTGLLDSNYNQRPSYAAAKQFLAQAHAL